MQSHLWAKYIIRGMMKKDVAKDKRNMKGIFNEVFVFTFLPESGPPALTVLFMAWNGLLNQMLCIYLNSREIVIILGSLE